MVKLLWFENTGVNASCMEMITCTHVWSAFTWICFPFDMYCVPLAEQSAPVLFLGQVH